LHRVKVADDIWKLTMTFGDNFYEVWDKSIFPIPRRCRRSPWFWKKRGESIDVENAVLTMYGRDDGTDEFKWITAIPGKKRLFRLNGILGYVQLDITTFDIVYPSIPEK